LVGGLSYALGNLFVHGPLRNNLGMSRVRVAYTAGEAIGPDLFSFYRSIGVNVNSCMADYRNGGVRAPGTDHEARADTVGVRLRWRGNQGGGQRRNFGEVGRFAAKSYYKNPEATAEVLTRQMVGTTPATRASWTAHGHLKIIDRVKDVGRIKGGAATTAPCLRRSMLKTNSSFSRTSKKVVAYGDQREKVCVMINIDFEAVGNWG